MHPAASVIFFTVASGAGYGLLAIAGIAGAVGVFAGHRLLGIASVTLALLLITAGLLSSTVHLGHPERAWRALSQWRSSWLSREGVAALATYVPAVILWLSLAGGRGGGGAVTVPGLLAAAGAVATVWCTGMIYATLKPIREWHSPWTTPVYLAFALATGMMLWLGLWALAGPETGRAGMAAMALASLAAAALAKYGWLTDLGGARGAISRESAIGLAGRGTARVLEWPHTGTNFLLEEMGFRIGRKHAGRLTRLMWVLGFAMPALMVLASLAWGPMALLAAVGALAGATLERWLFFATATHTVTLYYR